MSAIELGTNDPKPGCENRWLSNKQQLKYLSDKSIELRMFSDFPQVEITQKIQRKVRIKHQNGFMFVFSGSAVEV